MIFVGIDPSLSSTGIVVLKDGNLVMSINVTHKPVKRKSEKFGVFTATYTDRVGSILNSLDKTIAKREYNSKSVPAIHQVCLYARVMRFVFKQCVGNYFPKSKTFVGIEIPFGTHAGAGAKVDRIFAAAVLAAYEGFPFISFSRMLEFPPAAIKKFVGCKGNCKKDMVVKQVYKLYGFDTEITDLADAYALAKLTEHTVLQQGESQ